jgi:hypothetical protein
MDSQSRKFLLGGQETMCDDDPSDVKVAFDIGRFPGADFYTLTRLLHMHTWITLSVIPWASFLSFHEVNAFSVEV